MNDRLGLHRRGNNLSDHTLSRQISVRQNEFQADFITIRPHKTTGEALIALRKEQIECSGDNSATLDTDTRATRRNVTHNAGYGYGATIIRYDTFHQRANSLMPPSLMCHSLNHNW